MKRLIVAVLMVISLLMGNLAAQITISDSFNHHFKSGENLSEVLLVNLVETWTNCPKTIKIINTLKDSLDVNLIHPGDYVSLNNGILNFKTRKNSYVFHTMPEDEILMERDDLDFQNSDVEVMTSFDLLTLGEMAQLLTIVQERIKDPSWSPTKRSLFEHKITEGIIDSVFIKLIFEDNSRYSIGGRLLSEVYRNVNRHPILGDSRFDPDSFNLIMRIVVNKWSVLSYNPNIKDDINTLAFITLFRKESNTAIADNWLKYIAEHCPGVAVTELCRDISYEDINEDSEDSDKLTIENFQRRLDTYRRLSIENGIRTQNRSAAISIIKNRATLQRYEWYEKNALLAKEIVMKFPDEKFR